MAKHSAESLLSRHPAISREYSDSTARTGDSNFTSVDLGLFAWQKDDNTVWLLKAISPSIQWQEVGSASLPVLSEDQLWLGDSGGNPQATSIGSISHGDFGDTGTNTHTQIDSHISNTGNPHSVTKTQIGLSNVPNIDTTSAVANDHIHTNKSQLDLVTDGDHDVRTDNPHSVTFSQVGAAESSHTHIEDDITDLDHTDSNAVHVNSSGEINAISVKSSPTDQDIILIEDSAASYAKKKIQISSIVSDVAILGYIYGYKITYFSSSQIQILSGIARNSDNDGFISYNGAPISVSLASSGVNGLDTGSESSSTWYYVWIIYNPTTDTTAGLISTSSTSPTMPSGYTKKRRIGSFRNNSSSNIIPFAQGGTGIERRYMYTDGYKSILVFGTNTSWTDVDCSDELPPVSRDFLMHLKNLGTGGQTVYVRTNGQTSNDLWRVHSEDGIAETMVTDSSQLIEYYVQSGASAGIFAMGYREDL
jgi:hypothetical protein